VPRQQPAVAVSEDWKHETAVVVNKFSEEFSTGFSIDDLVKNCMTTSELEVATAEKSAKELGDADYRYKRSKVLDKLIKAGTATDEQYEERAILSKHEVWPDTLIVEYWNVPSSTA
jgi:hypothetical protein